MSSGDNEDDFIPISDELFEKLTAIYEASDIEEMISQSGVDIEKFELFISELALDRNDSVLRITELLQERPRGQADHRKSETLPASEAKGVSQERRLGGSVQITPILLCGDDGDTRLWPLSRPSYPRQFAAFFGSESLFQTAACRLTGPDFAAPIVVTGSHFRFIVTEQLAAKGINPREILIEPEARNTAPAVLAAAMKVAAIDPDTLILIAPSDNVVTDIEDFHTAVAAGAEEARSGRIVTFGIRPTRPETGYGWLELATKPRENVAVTLSRFVEKPDLETANEMLTTGNYLWNTGFYLFSARTILDAFSAHAPNLVPPVKAAVDSATADLGFFRLDPTSWSEAEDISVDYAIMERATNLSVVPCATGWSDICDWDTVWATMGPDPMGNSIGGPVTAIDCEGSMLRSESERLEVVAIGLKDVIAVAMPDAVLVADRSRASEVKYAVASLKNKGAKQADTFSRDSRPWGWFEAVAVGEGFRVNRVVVYPGASLALQSHAYRAQHWIVVMGTAKVTVNNSVELASENQSFYTPLGAVYRIENPGKQQMVLIEVLTASYPGESDITRYEDVDLRRQGANG